MRCLVMDNEVVILSLLAGFRVAVFDLITTLRRVLHSWAFCQPVRN